MGKSAFAHQPFGEFSQVLVGQINRGMYGFVMEGDSRICDFAGWALTSRGMPKGGLQDGVRSPTRNAGRATA